MGCNGLTASRTRRRINAVDWMWKGHGVEGCNPGLAGFRHLPGYLARQQQRELASQMAAVAAAAPFYRPTMPGTGKPLTVRMTNCGALGWVSDREGGYRYQATHPVTGHPWPALPEMLLAIWADVAGYSRPPEACLLNRYGATARMGSHRDADEADRAAPVVSISLGDDATFHIGGLRRADPRRRLLLKSGDVLVMGGAARMAYHGVDRIHPGTSNLLAEGGRLNLTLRRVTGGDGKRAEQAAPEGLSPRRAPV
jgi:DNA oxidative demethylase